MAKKVKKVFQPAGGRPKLPDGAAKPDRRLPVRVFPHEIASLKTRATKEGQSLTAWVRQKLGLDP